MNIQIGKKTMWTVITLVLAVLSVYLVIRMSGMSPSQFLEGLRGLKIGWVAAAILCMLGIVFFEGEAVLSILKRIGYPRSHRHGFLIAAGDTYFSAITPSATGGQPASAFFMIQGGVPAAAATAALLLNMVMYNSAILTIGTVCVISEPAIFLHFQPVNRFLIIAGFLVLAFMGVLFFLLLCKQRILFAAAEKVISFLTRRHLMRHPEKWYARLQKAAGEFSGAVKMMSGGYRMMLSAYVFNLLQRVSQFGVTLCAHLAKGGSGSPAVLWKLFTTQCFVSLGANCVPIPGSMGVTDYLMLDGYMNLMNRETAFSLQMISRGLSFYCCVLLSGLVTLIGYLRIRNRKKKQPGA
jgi:uncharacterized protein (TIRG00374 family)